MSVLSRAARGFAAAALSVLTFHQGTWALLHAAGLMPAPPYPTDPVPPLGVPRIVDYAFWGGLYGAALGALLPRLPRAPPWLLGLGMGLLAVLVAWFVVAPLKGLPAAAGFLPVPMLVGAVIHAAWGIGTGLILPLLPGRRAATAG